MTFRVMAGFSAIWAGTAKELQDGVITMTGKKYNVTEDVLTAAAIWLCDNNMEHVLELESGRKVILKVEIEEAKA